MCVHPITLLLSITPDNWDVAETCSEVAHREEGGRGTPVRTHLSKLLSAVHARSGGRFKITLLQAVQKREKTSHEVMSYITLKENDICRRST